MTETIDVNQLNESGIINKDEIKNLIEVWLPKKPKKIYKLYDTAEDAPNVGSFIKNVITKGKLLF